jgi:hypothetical protein
MNIYGCDFSGAKDAAGRICICHAKWDGQSLHLLEVRELEERLDLVRAIRTSPGFWGIDMPFSIPANSVQSFGGWKKMIGAAHRLSRREFKNLFPVTHSTPAKKELFRLTDLLVGAKSPISSTPLDMLGMLYGSFKVLDMVMLDDARVYPFMESPDMAVANLFEVYPRSLMTLLKLRGHESFAEVCDRFEQLAATNEAEERVYPIRVQMIDEFERQITSEHMRDAVFACLIIAYATITERLSSDWSDCPAFLTEQEWQFRHTEGAVVRIANQ